MFENSVSSKTSKKEQVLISIFIVAILLLSSGSMVAFASGSHTMVVKPSGDKTGATDTKAIQAALNTCTGSDPRCTVQLLAGTYYISSQITVYGFQGSFAGMGQGQTNIMALGNMPSPNPEYNTPSSPWWAALPGASNPWPALFTFEGGTFAISGMTITDTSPTPTQGWYWPTVDGAGWNTALISGIEITGLRAYATVDHLTVIGAAGDYYGYNMANAVHIEGSMLPSGWTNPEANTIMLTGTFSVTNSVFTNAETGAFGNYLTNANVAFCDNTFTSPIASPAAPAEAFAVMDVSSTSVLICGNHGTATGGFAVWAGQSIWKSGLLPSTVTIMDNNFQVNEGALAVILEDAGEANFGTSPTLNAVVSGNVFQNSYSCLLGAPTYACQDFSVIYSNSLENVAISQNTVLGGYVPVPGGPTETNAGAPGIYVLGGPGTVSGNTITGGYVGVWVDYANDVQVTGNTIKNSATWGIAVTDGSSYNTITRNIVYGSGTYDLYWDGLGTGNIWCGNLYHTSYPSVLSSC